MQRMIFIHRMNGNWSRPRAKPPAKGRWGSKLLQRDGAGGRGAGRKGVATAAGGSGPKGQRAPGKLLGFDQRGSKWVQREERREAVLMSSGTSGNKLFRQPVAWCLWATKNPGHSADGQGAQFLGLKVPGIAQPAGRVGALVFVVLMRFLSLRLKPKAAAAPRRGRGPGTLVPWGTLEGTSSKDGTPMSSSG